MRTKNSIITVHLDNEAGSSTSSIP